MTAQGSAGAPATPSGTVGHLDHLDGIRGLLAVYVLCYHFLAFNPVGLGASVRRFTGLFQYGHAAVGFFIVLSGYSLMLPVVASAAGTVRGGLTGYLKRRARRILPPYYAALLLSIVAVALAARLDPTGSGSTLGQDLSFASVGSHLLLVHTWVPGQHATINMALWSVATEWHIYFLFPTILLPLWRRFGAPVLVPGAFALGLLPCWLLPAASDLSNACPWYVGLFAIGMAGAAITSSPGHLLMRTRPALTLLFAGSLSAYLALKFLRPQSDAVGAFRLQWLKDGLLGLICLCVLIGCARARRGRCRPLLLRVLESRPAVLLGGSSYSLYATHCAVLTTCNALTDHLHLAPPSSLAVRALFGMPVALGVGFLFSLWFEKPFTMGGARIGGGGETTLFPADAIPEP